MQSDNHCRSSEEALRAIFSAFGLVQTCIVNVDKRHAFVKMITRQDAVAAKEGMERYKSSEMQLRVGSRLLSHEFVRIPPAAPSTVSPHTD